MSRRITRREFHRLAAAAGALAVVPFGSARAQVRFASPPFQLGVASGDPSADGFVIWTRLAPEPFDSGYLGQTIFEVAWEVAEDAGFARIVKQGNAWARPHLAHAVHAEVDGLQPGREYFYRFRLGRSRERPRARPHLPGARNGAGIPPVCVCLLRALRTGILFRLSLHGRGPARPDPDARRLYI